MTSLLIPVILACSGWQFKQTTHMLQAPQFSTPPKNLRLHWSREASNPWQFIRANQVFFTPWIEGGHFLLRKLSFKGDPWCSCRHITSPDRYVKSWCAVQTAPHVPLYLTCKWPTLGVFIPNRRTSKPVKDGWMTVLWISVRYCTGSVRMKPICLTIKLDGNTDSCLRGLGHAILGNFSSLRLFKLKTERETKQTGNLTEMLQNWNQNSHLSWVSLIRLWTTAPVRTVCRPDNVIHFAGICFFFTSSLHDCCFFFSVFSHPLLARFLSFFTLFFPTLTPPSLS